MDQTFLIGVLLLILEMYICQDLHFVVFIVRRTPGFGTDDPVVFHVGGSRLLFDCFEDTKICLYKIYV